VRGGEIADPLQRDAAWFVPKRCARMAAEFATNTAYMARVKQVYGHGELIDAVEALKPGPGWRSLAWPW